MTEHPLLLNDEMVRALQSGRKTQTRRPMKPQPERRDCGDMEYWPDEDFWAWSQPVATVRGRVWERGDHFYKSPFGKPGDQLWIREAFAVESNYGVHMDPPPHNDGRPVRRGSDEDQGDWWEQCHYRATDAEPELDSDDADGFDPKCKWTPSIHMPRWASRFSVTVKRVWCERVKRASHEDMIAEGIDLCNSSVAWIVQQRFANLWDGIYAKPKRVPAKGPISHYASSPWEDVRDTREHKGKPWHVNGNPWVWACEWEPLSIERTEQ